MEACLRDRSFHEQCFREIGEYCKGMRLQNREAIFKFGGAVAGCFFARRFSCKGYYNFARLAYIEFDPDKMEWGKPFMLVSAIEIFRTATQGQHLFDKE